ncbi:MAG: PorT family protein [Chitinophagaceae bacterium]|nr:PorT family protein [Chitinophagaceae bacterium]
MKVKLLFLSAIVLLSASSFAQGFKVGVKGGASINKITGQSFKDQFSFGYHAGGFATIGLGKKFAIQPEVLFNQTNIDTSSKFSDIYHFNKITGVKLNQLYIPILLNYNANKILSLQAGPQFGIIMNKSKTFIENGKDAFKSGDLSMLAGVQLKLSSFRVYGRYAIGLSNLNDIDNKEKWKSQSIQLGVGFTL